MVRTLYIAGLLMLDAVVLLLGAGVMTSADLDKAGTLAVVASLPTLLLVLPHLPVAHVELRRGPGESEQGRRQSRRVAALISGLLTAAGAIPLLAVAAAASARPDLAVAAVVVSVGGLIYAFGLGEKVRPRRQDRPPQVLLPPTQFRRRGV
jgi:hypothetical protein